MGQCHRPLPPGYKLRQQFCFLAWHNLGVAYYGKNDLKQATDCFQKAIWLTHIWRCLITNSDSFTTAKMIMIKRKESWQNYLKETPAGTKNIDVLRTWNNLASLAAERKNFDSAINLYNKATEIDPDYPHAYYGKAQVLATMGKNDEALTTLKTALDKGYKRKNNLLKDWEFEELRKSPQFNELMKQYFPE
ncbi:MAG: tetratricopeptide repeat protein [Saprospiraceae bacterium]